MESYFGITPTSGSLAHYGVKGMKWGVRRKRRMAEKAQQRRDKTAKRVAKAIGRTAVTAFMKTRGVDVRWRN